MSNSKETDFLENVLFGLVAFTVYVIPGMIVGSLIDALDHPGEATYGDVTVWILLWPLFALKYIGIFVLFLFEHGWELLSA